MKQKGHYQRLLLLLVLAIGLAMPQSEAYAQSAPDKKVTLKVKNTPAEEVFKSIRKQSGLNFFYSSEFSRTWPKLTLNIVSKPVMEAVAEVTNIIGCTYERKGNVVNVVQQAHSGKTRKIRGCVTDGDNQPLMGVPVCIGESRVCTVTDMDGMYSIEIPVEKTTLKFTYVGMDTHYAVIPAGTKEVVQNVMMKSDVQLGEVVVNGMFERRKESFTGASTTFTKEELTMVGNQNILKSLKNLDPSFQIMESLDMGSNPNAMPEIQMRGETSLNLQGDYEGNANQPLFILDGFETTLEKVWDLDMNRVQSVTLLKDAAAKAIYGSKAGNGVVVIKTVRPKSGEMRVTYNGNLNIEAPDLTGYNLMNAQEKFDWEKVHHKYDGLQAYDDLYKSVYDAIASGVDTYWLSQPLHTGIGQKHSLSLEGGDTRVRYILGLSYNDTQGVMKGSGRSTLNINSTLSYTYKNMVFRNQMDFTRNWSENSPYGSFSEYVSLEPYFAPYDSNGNLKQILGYQNVGRSGTFENPVYNPLYNASLNTKDTSGYTTFTDNFDMDWRISDNFRFTARFSYSRTENGSDLFYPSGHTMFIEYDANGMSERKGRYTKQNGQNEYIYAQAGLNWNQTFGEHSFFVNGTWNLQSSNSRLTTVMAEGFGNDGMDDISMATSYYHDSRPAGSDSKLREVGLIGALNYSYADRYLFDASLRFTGSSVYGADNHWGAFWSTGLGWNLHKEKFFPENSVVKQLKLRYSLGYTGTQNFNPYQARAKYQYGDFYYDGRLRTTLIGLPNTELKWQKVYDNNWGMDLALGSFLTARFEYYVQNTDNMLSDITLPASTGFQTFKENMGEIQNKGVEVALGITPYRNNEDRSWVTFTFTALHNKNKIKKIYDIFKKNNDDADNNLSMEDTNYPFGSVGEANEFRLKTTRPATRFYEGSSMTAIWGVRSLGIDPMTGKELFLTKDGDVTDTWNTADQVVIGDSNPNWRGTIGISSGYKGFTFSVTASYKCGGEIYNSTLVDRVENITGYGNLDKRVNDTWIMPGDHTSFKYIAMSQSPTTLPNMTRPTSRFVQKDNELYFSSINVGYDFFKAKWLKKAGLERLKVNFYANELARFNSVKVERGTSYPFARTFSLSVNATF